MQIWVKVRMSYHFRPRFGTFTPADAFKRFSQD